MKPNLRALLPGTFFIVAALSVAFPSASAFAKTKKPESKATPFHFKEETGVISLAPHFIADSQSGSISSGLAEILGRMTGREIKTAEGDSKGIVLGIAADFPELAKENSLNPNDPFSREDYLIRSSPDRLLIVGATPAAVRLAVADLLHRWGYRQYFPTKSWEIVPKSDAPVLTSDEVQRPAFVFRDIFTVNYLPGEEDAYKRWQWLNRLGNGFQLNTRHSYQAIHKRHREIFDKNPDFFAFVNGEPQDAATKKKFKFNAAKPELLQLLVEDAKAILTAENAEDSISMDPSDFGGWDNSGDAFHKIGSPSNQAVTMANVVAKEVAAPLNKYVGMYAYYDHQFPPSIMVEPNVIVSFATRFLKPDRDLLESIREWRNKGVELVGIRDYHSYWDWDLAMPGRAQGGNLDYLERAIPRYQKLGARFYTSESQSAWGAYGLGFYMTTRLLWNPEEDPKAIVDDFLKKCFGPAAEPMARFYSLLNGKDSVLVRQTTPGEFYSPLLEAWEDAKGNDEVRQRIVELIAYVRYVELLGNLERANEDAKASALNDVYTWAFRIAPMQMLPTKGMALRAKNGLRSVYSRFPNPSPADLAKMLEKASENPPTHDELLAYAKNAIESHPSAHLSELTGNQKPMESPWVRNGACLIFPLKAGDQVTAALLMRRFGFSEHPRYVVLDPDREIVQRGQMKGDNDTITIEAKKPGNYSLVTEFTPNLIKCRADRMFHLLPSVDFANLDVANFRGSFYFSGPKDRSFQISAGGQGENEKTNLKLLSTDRQTFVAGEDFNGVQPLVIDLQPLPNGVEYQLMYRAPSSGNFEDLFFKFNGPYAAPLALERTPSSVPTASSDR